jgi:hypothetical protein
VSTHRARRPLTLCSVSGGGLRVDVMWYIAYVTLAILVTFLIPFAFFYYESDTAE